MNRNITTAIGIAVVVLTSCASVKQAVLPEGRPIPATFKAATDTTVNLPALKDFFADVQLQSLIDTALANNYDLKAALQRIEIARANTRIAEAARLPLVNAVGGASLDRYGKYTMNGVGNYDTNLSPNI